MISVGCVYKLATSSPQESIWPKLKKILHVAALPFVVTVFRRFSLILLMFALHGNYSTSEAQIFAGNRRSSQKTAGNADLCRNPFVPFGLSFNSSLLPFPKQTEGFPNFSNLGNEVVEAFFVLCFLPRVPALVNLQALSGPLNWLNAILSLLQPPRPL